jgi:hypothetical protein
MDDDLLLAAFEDATLSEAALNHGNHVRLGWLYVGRYGLPVALERFSAALRRYAAAHGKAGLYHATITWAYLILIHERMALSPEGPWSDFADANPDLLTWSPSILDRYYDRELLASPLARATFILPRPQTCCDDAHPK